MYKKCTQVDVQWRGVFITCNRGREAQAAREARTFFNDCAAEMVSSTESEKTSDVEDDLEKQIASEVAQISDTKQKYVVVHEKLGIECVLFAQVRAQIDCVELVNKLCEKIKQGEHTVRYIQKISPVNKFTKLSEDLKPLASEVKVPEDAKFAIFPTLRLTTKNRDEVIKEVAKLVGPNRKVSLTDFEYIVMVTGFKTVLGCATIKITAEEYKKLCKMNLAQLNAL